MSGLLAQDDPYAGGELVEGAEHAGHQGGGDGVQERQSNHPGIRIQNASEVGQELVVALRDVPGRRHHQLAGGSGADPVGRPLEE